ncbi:Uncharacterized protein TCAP_04704 [Tolypocladium capitatum]|uniref:Uncharacterized protein n=1 Tax=Tolypocladium capitatum TaxID=45235 RepID=A0A2K3QCV7_9HYPO|nr:Uncharacterized protein TCAP_04704 [Tolypocladium capitatum]
MHARRNHAPNKARLPFSILRRDIAGVEPFLPKVPVPRRCYFHLRPHVHVIDAAGRDIQPTPCDNHRSPAAPPPKLSAASGPLPGRDADAHPRFLAKRFSHPRGKDAYLLRPSPLPALVTHYLYCPDATVQPPGQRGRRPCANVMYTADHGFNCDDPSSTGDCVMSPRCATGPCQLQDLGG